MIIEHAYGMTVDTTLSVDEAESAIREALAAEGFGILTEIDVAATLREKLGVERDAYRILGAYNPALANEALGIDQHIGLLLPCNVVVCEIEGGTRVEALDPGIMSRVADAGGLDAVAGQARERLQRALSAVDSA